MAWEGYEGVARSVHEETGIGPPVDAFELAGACGLTVVAGARGEARLDGDVLSYDATARPVRQHGQIAHETAHYVLRLYGESHEAFDDGADPEAAARYTAGALLLPRARFDRDLLETAWDLRELQRRHPNASAEMIARRLTQLREAVATVLDNGRVRDRIRSPWMPEPSKRMTSLERELADAALETGEMQSAGNLLAAYPFFDGHWRRVIVVAEARQLSLRL